MCNLTMKEQGGMAPLIHPEDVLVQAPPKPTGLANLQRHNGDAQDRDQEGGAGGEVVQTGGTGTNEFTCS